MNRVIHYEHPEENLKNSVVKAKPTRYKEVISHLSHRRVPVLSIQDSRLTRWNILICILAIWSVLSAPFVSAFAHKLGKERGLMALALLTDSVYVFDVFLNFRTSFINRHTGDEIFNPSEIAKHYLVSMKLILDILASFPFDYIVYAIDPSSSAHRILAFLRIIRVYRLQKLLMYLRARDEVKQLMKFIQLLVYLIMYVHVVGCVWFMLVSRDETWIPPTDIIRGSTNLYNEGAWTQYWFCFYHSVFLLVGIEISVTNEDEYAFAVFFYILGAMITAVVIGQMAEISSNLNRKASRFAEIADNANSAMKNMNLPNDLQLKIFDYLIATQNILEFKEQLEAFEQIIPPTVQQEVRANIYKGIVQLNSLFRESTQLADDLTKFFKSKFHQPDEAVVSFRENSISMFFIASGKCEVEILDEQGVAHLVRYLRDGDYFGELGLVYNTKRTATVTTSVYSSLAEISKLDFLNLARKYPDLMTSFKARVKQYKDPFRCFLKNCLNRIVYFQGLPDELQDELIYSMESTVYEAKATVMTEGELTSSLLIVGEGSLSFDFKVKTTNPDLVINEDDELGNGESFNTKLLFSRASKLAGAKQQTRSRLLMSGSTNEHYLKVLNLDVGGIFGAGQVLVETTNVLKISANEPSATVLRLSLASIKRIARTNRQLNTQNKQVKTSLLKFDTCRLETLKQAPLLDCLPMYPVDITEDSFKSIRASIRFKTAVISVTKRSREIKLTNKLSITNFVKKLKAIMQAEERGLVMIARDIAKGDIDPEVIDSADLLDLSEISKPLLNKFAAAAKQCKSIITFLEEHFSSLTSITGEHKDKIERFRDNIEEVRMMVTALENKVK
jgi:CRP-like cAMP-binding protein